MSVPTLNEKIRCLEAVAQYMERRDDSPRCATDLREIKSYIENLRSISMWCVCWKDIDGEEFVEARWAKKMAAAINCMKDEQEEEE